MARASSNLPAGVPRAVPVPVLLMVRGLGLGGTERQLVEIALGLDRGKFEPHVGCFRPDGVRGDELRAAGIPVVEFPVRSFKSLGVLRGARQMGAYVTRHRVQLVHTFDVPMNLFGIPAARAFGVPCVLGSQRAYRSLTPGLRHLLRVTDLLADGIVVNCLAMQRHLVEDENVEAGRVHLCYNAIDNAAFQPGPRARPPELGGASLVIGVVCVLRPEKDLTTLFAAFGKVRCRREALKLVIVGGGLSLAGLEQWARELDLGDAVRFIHSTPNVVPWLRSIDIFVLPSLSEAFSNSLMEAMACGCCPVASEVGGNLELVEEGVTGLRFRPGDVAGLAAALARLIDDSELRERLAASAAAFIHHHFSRSAAARRMEEIYSGLLGSGGGIWRAARVGLARVSRG